MNNQGIGLQKSSVLLRQIVVSTECQGFIKESLLRVADEL